MSTLKFISLTIYCAFIGIFSSYLYNNSVFFGHKSVVSASRFDLINDEGRNIASFGNFDGVSKKGDEISSTAVVFFDDDGNTRFTSGMNNIENIPFISLSGPDEIVKLLLHLDEDDYPQIYLSKAGHDPGLILYSNADGSGLTVYDDSKTGRVNMFWVQALYSTCQAL